MQLGVFTASFAFHMCWFRKCIFVRHDGRESHVMAVCFIRTVVTAETVAVLCPRRWTRCSREHHPQANSARLVFEPEKLKSAHLTVSLTPLTEYTIVLTFAHKQLKLKEMAITIDVFISPFKTVMASAYSSENNFSAFRSLLTKW